MTARCGGRYGTRSTTPGTEITTDGVQAGEILVCELDGDQAHDIHRSGKWWWNTGAMTANDGPLPEPVTVPQLTSGYIDRDALAKALFVATQPPHLEDFMFAGERYDDAEALADEVIGLMSGTLRTCRVCGCTPYRGCWPVACAWVPGETDLCTSCTTDQGAVAPPTSTPGGD